MAVGERWMTSLWPFVRGHLPPAPARVLEIGCGRDGGFVSRLREGGHEAVGVDPDAPDGAGYHRIAFEQFPAHEQFDVIVASRSLHHVGDLGVVVGRMAAALRPGGTLIVVEWAWELFDEPTARWCFARLDDSGEDDRHWMQRRRDAWLESGEAWETYFQTWAAGHGLHPGERILAALDERFESTSCVHGPYFFPDLVIGEEAEQAAIDAGEVTATGVRYFGALRAT